MIVLLVIVRDCGSNRSEYPREGVMSARVYEELDDRGQGG